MLIKKRPSWAMAEADATSEHIYLNRREWLRAAGFAGLGLTTASDWCWRVCGGGGAAVEGYPAPRNMAYRLDRDITPEDDATTYTNFYEFGSSKNIWKRAQKLVTDPWMVTIDGLVETEMQLDAEDLIAKAGGLEERLYRHRCVEAWAMAVPWSGGTIGQFGQAGKAKARSQIFADGNIP